VFEDETVIDWLLAPFDHKLPVEAEDVSTTLPPAQKVVGPPAVIVGAAGAGVTETVTAVELGEEHPPASLTTV